MMGILLALALMVFPAQQAAMPSVTGTLQGKIVRAATQEPIAGVQVTLLGGPNAKSPQFTTDVNGTIRVDMGDGRITNVASVEVVNRLIANLSAGFDFGRLNSAVTAGL